MQVINQLISLTVCVSLMILILPFVNSSQEHTAKPLVSPTSSKNSIHELRPELQFEIILHGFLLWTSMGCLMPVGILAIRLSHREAYGRRFQILFYVHSVSQMLSVVLSTAGAVMSVKNFGNSFNNHHQRIGVGLYGMVWIQALIGFLRPNRGCKGRRVWFFVHWILGTTVSLLGVINIYTGLQAYHQKTSKGIQIWSIGFTIEISFIVLLYLLQDKWYVRKQGVTLGNEVEGLTDQVVPPTPRDKQKESTAQSC